MQVAARSPRAAGRSDAGHRRQCNAGYYKTAAGACARCADAIGKFSLAGATACTNCQTKPLNSAFVLPLKSGGFDGASDTCPW